MSAVLVAATLTVVHVAVDPARAVADASRPPRSSKSGLVAPEIATDVIPTNIVIGPASGESFAEVTVVAVQKVPMVKILRDGSVDPDQALAEWLFTVRYPRNNVYWPPFLP